MIAILIVTDTGKAYVMSESQEAAMKCIKSIRKPTKAVYVRDREKRLAYLGKAFDMIEGGGGNAGSKCDV